MATKEYLIAKIKENRKGGWGGIADFKDAENMERFLRRMLKNYSAILGYSEGDILRKIEGRRDYWSANYYQEAKFPKLENVKVFETVEELKRTFPSHKFVCPACNGISTDPNTCNSGKETSEGKICDWKSYGLFRTFGKGYRFVVKEDFLNRPVVYEIFMPVEIAPPNDKQQQEEAPPNERLCGCGDELQTGEDKKTGSCGICRSLDRKRG